MDITIKRIKVKDEALFEQKALELLRLSNNYRIQQTQYLTSGLKILLDVLNWEYEEL